MKKVIILLFCVLSGLLISCNDDEKYVPVPPEVSIVSSNGELCVMQEDTIVLKAKVTSPLTTTLSWSVNGEEVSTDTVYTFTKKEVGKYEVSLKATNADGEVSAFSSIEVYGKYRYGTFILNEGSVLNGLTSTLIFISPKGEIMDSVYYRVNGTFLGGCSQDLFIKDKKMYILAQNGGYDGYLVIADAETLKKERGFQEELDGKLSMPSHIAVLSENDIYMRDNKGVWRFNSSTGDLTFIKNTNGARKNTMAVADGKVFASQNKNLLVIESGKDTISQRIELSSNISGIIPASDGNLWVSCAAAGGENAKILKVNPKDYSIVRTNVIADAAASKLLAASYAAAPSITAKGDTLYMSALGTTIYRHIFGLNKTDFMVDVKDMVDNAGIVYNTVAVNPVTGGVLMNILKGFGPNYLTNQITIFDFSGTKPLISAAYNDYTRFPAGTFFTYNFK